MLLNVHERWLLRLVGLNGSHRRQLLATLVADGRVGGEVDVAAQEPGFKLAKRSVKADLAEMFDRLMSPTEPKVRKVVYGHRRYRRPVILAAALHQAGINSEGYRRGAGSGARGLEDFRRRTP